jgi:AmmeMemoRadiSam system protein B
MMTGADSPEPRRADNLLPRPPAVAGAFYPGTPARIDRALDELLAGREPVEPEPWAGAMVPHAGWVYSGRLAAQVFRRLVVPEQVVILCPNHTRSGAEWAVAPQGVWQWPGGQLASDPDLAGALADGVAGLRLDAAAHRDEHAVEVQLPILARLAPWCRVVGIAIGAGSLDALLEFGAQMAGVLRPMPRRPLLVVSSDLSHRLDEATARRLDRFALDAIETLDPARLYETVHRRRISMCGVGPCVVVMETLRRLDALGRCEQVGYTTSAEATGDTSSVVGYAGMLFG